MHGWIKGTSTPSLSYACDLAMRLGVCLADLHLGKKESLPERPILMLANQVSKRLRIKVDWPTVDKKLEDYLNQAEPISVRQIARELGIAKRTLYSHNDALMKRLAARYEIGQQGVLQELSKERLEAIHGLLDACQDDDLVFRVKSERPSSA